MQAAQLLKCVVVGDSGVGKSSILLRYANNQFDEFHEPTLGAAFVSKTEHIQDKNIKFQIWDTAGQQKYQSIAPIYYRRTLVLNSESQIALCVYDISNKKSFQVLRKWVNQLQENGPQNMMIVVIGNKCDKTEQQQVSYQQGKDFADANNATFRLTSAKQGKGISVQLYIMLGHVYFHRRNLLRAEGKKQGQEYQKIITKRYIETKYGWQKQIQMLLIFLFKHYAQFEQQYIFNKSYKTKMGNNHDKYFGKDKRKILVLGLPQCGKTCKKCYKIAMIQLIVQGKQANLKTQKTKNLNIRDANLDGLNVTFFDLAGGERQRIFWKQHYQGTQGIIYIIDINSPQDVLQTTLTQLNKLSVVEVIKDIPMAICLNKSDLISEQQLKNIEKKTLESLKISKMKYKIFATSYKNQNKLKEMMVWLLKETKPL